jgi:hypothetical protein
MPFLSEDAVLGWQRASLSKNPSAAAQDDSENEFYSVTTAFTRFRGWSTSYPLLTAT